MKYNPDGSFSVTLVGENDLPHGLFAADGSTRVTQDPGLGIYAPNGSIRIGSQGNSFYTPSGAMNGTLVGNSFYPIGTKIHFVLYDFENNNYPVLNSFSRASPGTAFSSTGLVSFSNNIPRVTNLGLLLEAPSTNILINSSDISLSVWTLSGGTIGTVPGADPSGGTTYQKFTETTAKSSHNIRQTLTLQALTYGVSAFVKASGRPFSILAFNSGNHSVGVDNSNGAVSISSGSPTVLKSRVLSNGWIYVSYVAVGTARNAGLDILASLDGVYANQMYVGNGSSGIGIYCPQLELSSSPSSPIFTGPTSATRAAETATILVPSGCTKWSATYGDSRTVVSGSGLVPGVSFNLVTGRPWIGLGNELKNMTFSP